MITHMVTEYYEAYTAIISGLLYNEDMPFPFDIGKLFCAGTNPNLIAMIHSNNIIFQMHPPTKGSQPHPSTKGSQQPSDI
jgi:hypothetical protein